MGIWKVIIPEAGTNMVLAPTAMGVTGANYSAQGVGTTVDQLSFTSYLGYRSYYVQCNVDEGGVHFVLSQLSNAPHYVTIRLKAAFPPVWHWALDAAGFHEPQTLAVEDDWIVYGWLFTAGESNASQLLKIQQIGVGPYDYYLGHIQVETNAFAFRSTPITGDIKGFTKNGYYWNGLPYASSSVRSAQERSGGREYDLDTDYKFKVRYAMGIGMPPITNNYEGMALLPGALFQSEKIQPRVLDLLAVTDEEAPTPAKVHKARKYFINAIKSDLVTPKQPVVFRYYGANANRPVQFYGHYDDGLQFQMNSGMIDKPVARFLCVDPFCYETHTQSKELTEIQAVNNADYVVRRINGNWSNVHTDFDGSVVALTKGIDGSIYMGGYFTMAPPVPDIDYIARWNPFTGALSALTGGAGSGTDNAVKALATAPNGDIYMGGLFHLAGTIANTLHIAYWDISASEFVPLDIGTDDVVLCMVFGLDGTLYVGGSFHLAGGIADTVHIAKWSGAAWTPLGTGTDGSVFALAVAPNGDIIAGGTFANANGVACAGIARWNGTTFVPFGAGITGGGASIQALAIDKAGNIYSGGQHTTADGVTCANIEKWNGKTFEPLGSGLNSGCYTLEIDDNGLLYAGGTFTTAGGIALADRMAVWNGTTWAHINIDLPGAAEVDSILANNKDLYIGYTTAGDGSASYVNSVVNSGSSSAFPVMKFYRAQDGTLCTLEFIKNETTGATLWLDYTLLKGETLTIDLTPGNRSIKSDFFGDVWRAVLRGSDLSAFCLLPGTNLISVYSYSNASMDCWAEWPLTHWAADTVAA